MGCCSRLGHLPYLIILKFTQIYVDGINLLTHLRNYLCFCSLKAVCHSFNNMKHCLFVIVWPILACTMFIYLYVWNTLGKRMTISNYLMIPMINIYPFSLNKTPGKCHQKHKSHTCANQHHSPYGRKSADRTEHGNYVIFLVFLATDFGNLEVLKVRKWNIFLKYISAAV